MRANPEDSVRTDKVQRMPEDGSHGLLGAIATRNCCRRTGPWFPPHPADLWCNAQAYLAAAVVRILLVYHEKSLSPDRELRVPDRLLWRDARDHGHPFPQRGHTPNRRRNGSAGPPGPQGRHTVWHPRGYRREPDRLLDRPQSGTTVRLEVGAVCKAHPRAPGATRRALRAPRRQGGLRCPFLLGFPPAGSAGSRHEPHALGDVLHLQRPRRGGVGYGGRSWWGLFLWKVWGGGGVGRARPPLSCFFSSG